MISRDAIVAEARSWIGTPWQHGAALKYVGCDCIGLVRGVGKKLGMPLADDFANDQRFRGYGQPPNPKLLLKACEAYLDRIQMADALHGDVFLARVEVEPQHFGIISSVNPLRVIHSYIQVGRVTENICDERWRAHVLRMFRFRGIE